MGGGSGLAWLLPLLAVLGAQGRPPTPFSSEHHVDADALRPAHPPAFRAVRLPGPPLPGVPGWATRHSGRHNSQPEPDAAALHPGRLCPLAGLVTAGAALLAGFAGAALLAGFAAAARQRRRPGGGWAPMTALATAGGEVAPTAGEGAEEAPPILIPFGPQPLTKRAKRMARALIRLPRRKQYVPSPAPWLQDLRPKKPRPGFHGCTWCLRSNSSKEALAKHRLLPHPFACPLCAHRFMEEDHLVAHVQRSHLVSVEWYEEFLDLVQPQLPADEPAPEVDIMRAIGTCMRDWCRENKPQNQHVELQTAMFKVLDRAIQRMVPNGQLYAFGSIMESISTAHSDLDLCVHTGADHQELLDNHSRRTKTLHRIAHAMEAAGLQPAVVVARVSTPVVRFAGNEHFLPCDVVLSFEGVRNSELLRWYIRSDPAVLQPLLRIVVRWAKYNNICNSMEGMLSSYILTLMVLHYLMNAGLLSPIDPAKLPQDPSDFRPLPRYVMHEREAPAYPLAARLLGFIDYYAYHFDSARCVVHLRASREEVRKSSKGWESYAFAVENPIQPEKNAAKALTPEKWAQCVAHFRVWARLLRRPKAWRRFFAFDLDLNRDLRPRTKRARQQRDPAEAGKAEARAAAKEPAAKVGAGAGEGPSGVAGKWGWAAEGPGGEEGEEEEEDEGEEVVQEETEHDGPGPRTATAPAG